MVLNNPRLGEALEKLGVGNGAETAAFIRSLNLRETTTRPTFLILDFKNHSSRLQSSVVNISSSGVLLGFETMQARRDAQKLLSDQGIAAHAENDRSRYMVLPNPSQFGEALEKLGVEASSIQPVAAFVSALNAPGISPTIGKGRVR